MEIRMLSPEELVRLGLEPGAASGEDGLPANLDLHRLRTYVSERVKESARMEEAAWARGQDAIARSHHHSTAVGRQLLAEVEVAINSTSS